MYKDPNGESIVGLLVGMAVGTAINAISYTIQAACAQGGINSNWNTGQFFQSMAMGAVSGFFSAGIREQNENFVHYYYNAKHYYIEPAAVFGSIDSDK